MIHKSEVLLATDSSITMYDCVTENATFRHCECHWTVHVEEDSMVGLPLVSVRFVLDRDSICRLISCRLMRCYT